VAGAKNFGTDIASSVNWTFNNLTFSSSSGSQSITTSSTGTGTIEAKAIFTIGANITLDAGDRTFILSLAGTPFTKTGTFTYNTSTIRYTGNGASITALSGTAGTDGYYNLECKPSGSTANIMGTGSSQTIAINNNLIAGNGTNAGCNAQSWDPIVDVGGNVTIATNGTFIAADASGRTMTVGGSWSNSGTLTANALSTINFDSTTTGNTLSGTLSGSSSFYNLTFSGSGGEWSLGSNVAATNTCTFTAGTVTGSNDVTCARFTGSNGAINLTGGTAEQRNSSSFVSFGPSGSPNWTFYNFTFSNSSGASAQTLETIGNATFTITNILQIGRPADTQATGFNAGDNIWILSGTGTPLVFNGSSTLDDGLATFRYTGNDATTITTPPGSGYGTLQIFPGGVGATHTFSSGTLTLSNLVIGGNSNATGTVVDASTNNPNFQIYDNLTLCASTCSNQMTFTKGTGTITFNSLSPGILTDNNPTKQNIGTVILNKTNATTTDNIITLGSNIIADSISIDGTSTTEDTLDLASYTLTLKGNSTPFVVNSGATFTPSTGTIEYAPTSTSGVTVASTTYHHVIFNKASNTFTLGGALITNAGGNLTITAGTLDTSSGNNYAITVGGNWSNADGFTARNGLVTFNTATTATVGGGPTTFYGCQGSRFFDVCQPYYPCDPCLYRYWSGRWIDKTILDERWQ
jgi:hypothetical protein